MALVRATLPTALPTVRQFVGELRKLARETGSSPALDNLAQTLDGLEASSNKKALDIELVLLSPLDAEEANRLSAWLGPGFPPAQLLAPQASAVEISVPGPPLELRILLRSAQGRTPRRAGVPRPGVLVLVATRAASLDEDAQSDLDQAFEDRPHVVLVASVKPSAGPAAPPAAPPEEEPPAAEASPAAESVPQPPSPADDPLFKALETKAKSGAWTCLTHRTLPEMTLPVRLAATPWDSLQDLFRAHSVAGALEALMGVFGMAVEQQEKDIRINKAVSQQKLAKFGPVKGPGAAPSPIADLLADLKTRTQRLSQEFERGAGERLQDLLGLPAGALVRETEAMLSGLNDLETEPKAKTLGVKVPAEFEERANKLIRERVARHCGADLVALNDLFRLIGQEIEKTLAQAQNPPIVVQFRYLTDDRVRRMLDMYGIFQANFKGEIPSPGFSEYFASVRKYSMLLVMGASMFGAASFLRQYREYMIPATVLLVGFGIYQVAISTRQQRIETMDNQLDAARIQMRQEFRRIIGELQKQWSATLNQYLSEQIAGALAEIDAGIKESQGKKGGGDVNPERDRLLRQVQTLEASEKRLAASSKSRDALAGSIAQIRGDLKGLMPGPGGAPGPARPGMPMPGGLAGARPGMPAMPARPAMPAMPGAKAPPAADGKSSAMAEAKAKLDAMKAAKAAPPPASGEAAPGKPSAMAAFQAKMAASKAPKATPEAATESSAAPAPAPSEPKPSAAAAFQAKMAASKAAREAAKAVPPAAAPVAAGAEVAAESAPGPAAQAEAASPAQAAPAVAPGAPGAAAEAKAGAAAAFQAKMAAAKAAREAAKGAKAEGTSAASAAPTPAVAAAAPEVPPAPPTVEPAAAVEAPLVSPTVELAASAEDSPIPATIELAAPVAAPLREETEPVPPPEPAADASAEPPSGFEETVAFEKPVIPAQKPE